MDAPAFCSQLVPSAALRARSNGSALFASRPPPAGMHAYVSAQYDFAYVRTVGKVAGTTVEKGYLYPRMCAALAGDVELEHDRA